MTHNARFRSVFAGLAAAAGLMLAVQAAEAQTTTQTAPAAAPTQAAPVQNIPVVVGMYLAIAKNWNSHYAKGAPGMPEMPLMEKWLVIGLVPQMFMWIAITIILGGLFGGLSLLMRKPSTAAAGSR